MPTQKAKQKKREPFWISITQGLNPVEWLQEHVSFSDVPGEYRPPFSYQASFIQDWTTPTRVVRKSRQIGMTTGFSREAIWKAANLKHRLMLFVSPSLRQSRLVMDRTQNAVDQSDELRAMIRRRNASELHFTTGSVCVSLPNSPELIRGYPATDIYLDEAAHFINDTKVMAAIRPMLIATHGTLTVASTPFGKRGIFYHLYRTAVDLKGVSSTIKFYDLYPSTINPNITEADIKREAEEGGLSDLEIQQEYYGIFIEEVDAYFPMGLIQPMALLDKADLLEQGVAGDRYFWGVDLGKRRDETVIYVVQWVNRPGLTEGAPERKVIKVAHVKAFSKTDYSDQIGEMGLLKAKFPPASVLVDRTGVGDAVVEMMRGNIPNVREEVFTDAIKQDLASRLRLFFEQKEIEVPNDRKLLMQLNGIVYRISKTGKLLFESPEKSKIKDDHPWALSLAVKAATLVHAPTLLKVE